MRGIRTVLHLPAFALAFLALMAGAGADDIDDARKLPAADAVPRLEALLEDALTDESAAQGDDEALRIARARAVRLHEALAELDLAAGRLYPSLRHLEGLVRRRGSAEDRVRYGEALLAIARAAAGDGRSLAGGLQPYLRDALAALKPITDGGAEAADALPLRARAAAAAAGAHYMLREFQAGLDVIARLDAAQLEAGVRAPLLDLRARCLYALEDFEGAGKTWLEAGDRIAAAAAFDAARQPAQSVPIYLDLIRARPTDEGLLRRALLGARFTGAYAALHAGLAAVEVPEGTAGVPMLRALAELLEALGKPAEAMAPLRQVAERDPTDATALVTLGRLSVLTAGIESEDGWDAAAAAYQEALRRQPDSDAAVAGLSFIAGRDFDVLWKQWRNERVTSRCLGVQRAMVAADPEDALSLSNLANTLRTLGHHEEAVAMYARAREANPFDPSVVSDAGLAQSAAGHPDVALADYEHSIELDPGHLAGRQNAARALWLLGRDEEAAAHLGAAIRTARAVGRSAGTYRFLLERTWRTQRRPEAR